MADLQPLGSEKLQGMDKIQRILEIARFKENTPSRVNETSKNEYKLTLADGNEYQIIREKSGYIIKQTISESETDYMTPIQDRKYYSSYSQALKKLNLMAKDMNDVHGNDEGTSLFSEQRKFTLKTPNRPEKKNTDVGGEVENVPAPPMPPAPPAPSPSNSVPPSPPSDVEGDEPPMPPMGDEEGDDEPPMPPMGDEGEEGEDHDDVVTFKTIQKLTGKLGQKLRTLESDEENQMSSKDIKYVINSILSALNLDSLEDEDKEDIMNKFEGIEDEEGGDDFTGNFGDEEGSEEEGEESTETGEEEPLGFGEMEENENIWADLGKDIAMKTMTKGMTPGQFGEEEDDDVSKLDMIADNLFMESKVEDILTNYFTITESEKKFNRVVESKRTVVKKINRKDVNQEIKRLSESIDQEIASRKLIEKKSNVKFVGKTNKRNLVFEISNKQFKVSPKGIVL
jgi:hypothetical protein